LSSVEKVKLIGSQVDEAVDSGRPSAVVRNMEVAAENPPFDGLQI
jgi:hypothetical protein